VRKDQRRTLSAVMAGLDRVKVIVQDEAEPDSSASAQIERIVDQLGGNQHREHRRVHEVAPTSRGPGSGDGCGRRPGPRQL
jgi:hypothetical protein